MTLQCVLGREKGLVLKCGGEERERGVSEMPVCFANKAGECFVTSENLLVSICIVSSYVCETCPGKRSALEEEHAVLETHAGALPHSLLMSAPWRSNKEKGGKVIVEDKDVRHIHDLCFCLFA